MGLKIYALLCSNISNLYCFEYIPELGKTVCTLLYQYVKCLLLRTYPRVGVNNMHTFIQQYFKCLLFRIYPRVGENHMCILYPYVKCLLFRVYTCLGVNNMCTFTAIFSMFAVSHMSQLIYVLFIIRQFLKYLQFDMNSQIGVRRLECLSIQESCLKIFPLFGTI